MPLISSLPPFMVGGVGGRLVMLVSLGGRLFELMLIGLSRFRYLLAVFGLDKLQVKQSRGYPHIGGANYCFCSDGDDDNLPFTMRSSSTPVSWLGSHTESVIAAMYTFVLSIPIFFCHAIGKRVVSGIALPVRPDKLYTGSKDETIRALALLADYLDKEDPSVKIGAINNGLGLASAGSQNEQIRDKLTPVIGDPKAPLDVIAFTTISLALVYVGSCNEEVAQAIIFACTDQSELDLGDPLTRYCLLVWVFCILGSSITGHPRVLLNLHQGLVALGMAPSTESTPSTKNVRQPFPEPIGPQRGMMSCYGRLNFEYWVNDAASSQEPLVKEILSEEANILSKVLRKRIVAKLKVSKFVTKCLKQFDNKMNLSSPCIPFFEQVVVGKFEHISK
ncbi:26S proteasome regulatory complex component [Tanacetum coccineum]